MSAKESDVKIKWQLGSVTALRANCFSPFQNLFRTVNEIMIVPDLIFERAAVRFQAPLL